MALPYHNIGRRCVGYTLFIILTLSIRTTYAADLGLSYVQPSNTAYAIQSRHDDGISQKYDDYAFYYSPGDGLWPLNLRNRLFIDIVMVEMTHQLSGLMPNI